MIQIAFPENYAELFYPKKGSHKNTSVYEKFYEWILGELFLSYGNAGQVLFDTDVSDPLLLKKLVPPGKMFSVSAVTVDEDSIKKLRELSKKFIKKTMRFNAKHTELNDSYLFMNIGPCVDRHSKYPKSSVIINPDKLWENRTS